MHSQLFGEADADEEVSPDTEDPEAVGEAGERAVTSKEKENATGGIERASTRSWAEEIGYDPVRLFNKVSSRLQHAKKDVSDLSLGLRDSAIGRVNSVLILLDRQV